MSPAGSSPQAPSFLKRFFKGQQRCVAVFFSVIMAVFSLILLLWRSVSLWHCWLGGNRFVTDKQLHKQPDWRTSIPGATECGLGFHGFSFRQVGRMLGFGPLSTVLAWLLWPLTILLSPQLFLGGLHGVALLLGLGMVGLIALGAVWFYFLPSFVLFWRGRRTLWGCLCMVVANVLLGWTGLGWVCLFVMGWALRCPVTGPVLPSSTVALSSSFSGQEDRRPL